MENTQYYKNEEINAHVKHDASLNPPSLWVNDNYNGVISLNKMDKETLISEGFVECSRHEFDDAYNKIALKFISRRNSVRVDTPEDTNE